MGHFSGIQRETIPSRVSILYVVFHNDLLIQVWALSGWSVHHHFVTSIIQGMPGNDKRLFAITLVTATQPHP